MSDYSKLRPMRRSATLPSKLIPRKQPSSDSLRTSEKDLFYHPAAKVVYLTTNYVPIDTIESISWRSPTERTVAFAPLRLEKLYGLTVFLKCGGVVHAILKNSQCWCVDGESIFILPIRPRTYYRIELPNETEEDKKSVMEMKDALSKILLYEMTPCPFKRGFTVEIPEEAQIQKPKKPWRPKGRRESAPAQSVSIIQTGPAEEEAMVDLSSPGEDPDENSTDDSGFATKDSYNTILGTIPDDDESSEPLYVPGTPDLPKRSVTETKESFQTLLARFEHSSELQVDPDMLRSSSLDSFHSLELPSSPLPQSSSPLTSASPTSTGCLESAQCLSDDSMFEKVDFSGTRTLSDVEPDDLMLSKRPPSPEGPLSEKDFKPVPSVRSNADTSTMKPTSADLRDQFRRRSKASRAREISPMPPSSILVSASPPKKHDAVSIIQNTCLLVLVSPLALMCYLILLIYSGGKRTRSPVRVHGQKH